MCVFRCGHQYFVLCLSVTLPRYSGVLMGLSNTAGTLPGIVMPSFTSAVTHASDIPTLVQEWRLVFNVSAAVCWGGAVRRRYFAHACLPTPHMLF